MKYQYHICDVFTETPFGGNQLAVFPQAVGLTAELMQKIAREFNFSESAFVFPAESGHTNKVRIFTPTKELPFAGHPNIGTAFTLATIGAFGNIGQSADIVFEEQAGPVPITIRRQADGRFWCELKAPQPLSLGQSISADQLAQAVGLNPADILTTTHPPQEASVGVPFLMAELGSRAALERARPNLEKLEALAAARISADIHLYLRSGDDFDIRARMFAPLDGVPEDPATGSANCALAGLLTHYNHQQNGRFQFRIAQGVEMGRPSLLDARAEKHNGLVTAVWIGGNSVMFSEGAIEVG
jgi:trans-2,3-dihydro-3-hydroxyanthranilate isomerase